MPNNVTLPANSTVVGTDEVAGIHYQVVKVVVGVDNVISYISLGPQVKSGAIPVTLATDSFDAHNVSITEGPGQSLGAFGLTQF